jgi:hypothetical protein
MAGKLTWLLTHHFTWFPSLPSHLIASHPSSPFGRASSLEVAILPWRFLGGFLTCWTRRTRRAGRAPYLADFPFRICWQPGNLNHYLVSWHMTSVFRHLVLKTSPFLLASDLVPSWSLGHCWIPPLSGLSSLFFFMIVPLPYSRPAVFVVFVGIGWWASLTCVYGVERLIELAKKGAGNA